MVTTASGTCLECGSIIIQSVGHEIVKDWPVSGEAASGINVINDNHPNHAASQFIHLHHAS